jgi:hypothetical protein
LREIEACRLLVPLKQANDILEKQGGARWKQEKGFVIIPNAAGIGLIEPDGAGQ